MNLELAIKQYERLTASDGKDGSAPFILALLFDAKENYVQAGKLFQLAAERAPRDSNIRFFNGSLIARFTNKFELAIVEWEHACDLDFLQSMNLLKRLPDDASSHYPLESRMRATVEAFATELKRSPSNTYIAACYAFACGLCLGWDRGFEEFKKIDFATATNPRTVYLWALFLALAERWDESLKVLEGGLVQDRNLPAVLLLQARCNMKCGRMAQAQRLLERLRELDPRYEKGLQLLGEIYFRQNRFEQAAHLLQAAIKIDPRSAKTHFLLGRCHQETYQLDLALASYQEALRCDREFDPVYYSLGTALERLGRWSEAIENFEEAVRRNPRDSYAQYHLGLAYNQVGRHTDAVRAFEECIIVNPDDSFTHFNLGLAYEKGGQLQSAVASYKKAIAMSPNEGYARYHLALCYERMGEYSLAMQELEEVLRRNPQDAYAAYNLGSVYGYLGLPDRALEAYSRASELNPNDVYAHFNIAAILARDGLTEAANNAFKKALELTPANDGELALYSTLASQMAVNIEIAKLNAKIKETYLETVKAIISCLAEKDNYTAGHTNRVSIIATELGKALELPHDAMESLAIAAVLHDVGKLGVPDAILLKQGKLTTEEFLVMKEHPVKGAKILENVKFPWKMVVDCVKHHHERFDGTGYPDRLKGEEIPIGARILSLADFFDALATERPYKKAYPIQVVIEQAELQVNQAFDPKVVAALRQVSEKVAALYKPVEGFAEVPTWESSLVDSA